MVDLIRRGRRVGVAATSHKAIHNLLDEIQKTARKEGVAFRGLKKCTAGNPESRANSRMRRSCVSFRGTELSRLLSGQLPVVSGQLSVVSEIVLRSRPVGNVRPPEA